MHKYLLVCFWVSVRNKIWRKTNDRAMFPVQIYQRLSRIASP